jgi:hypothetical protein
MQMQAAVSAATKPFRGRVALQNTGQMQQGFGLQIHPAAAQLSRPRHWTPGCLHTAGFSGGMQAAFRAAAPKTAGVRCSCIILMMQRYA